MTTTATADQREERDAMITENYRADLATGLVMDRVAASDASVYGYQPPAGSLDLRRVLEGIGSLASQGYALQKAAFTILSHVHTGGDTYQMRSSVARAAADVIRAGYFDTVRAGSPEGYRRSECEVAYTEKQIILIHLAVDKARGERGPGWVMARIMRENNMGHLLPDTGGTK